MTWSLICRCLHQIAREREVDGEKERGGREKGGRERTVSQSLEV